MDISLNKNMPMVYDFIRVITDKHNNRDIVKRITDSGYTVSNRVTDALELMWDGLDSNVKGVELFFYYTMGYRCYMLDKYDVKIHEYNDINEFIEAAFGGPVDDIKVSLMKYYDKAEQDDAFYVGLCKDQDKMYEFITALDIPSTCKWELYGFMLNPEGILEPLKIFLHRVKRKLKNVYKANNEFLKSFHKEINVKIKNQPENFLKNEISKIFRYDFTQFDKEIIITYSLIFETLFYYYSTDDQIIVVLGTEYSKVIGNTISGDSAAVNDAFLKVFSDKHRMSIFRSLLNKEMFVGEIAEKHGMILSTTSYHLDLLLSAGVLVARAHGKKVYYKVNNELVADQLRGIADLVEKGTY